jgi:hypothetical protein
VTVKEIYMGKACSMHGVGVSEGFSHENLKERKCLERHRHRAEDNEKLDIREAG